MPLLTRPAPSMAALSAMESALASFRISTPTVGKRYASHQAQGRANGAKDGPGKRLGAKKTAGEYVVPGNIIFKQRGTLWYPGDNCFMGRDHTVHAGAPGYVKYYQDPARHPKRKFIGIVFERNQTLPQPANAVRRRKLGMLAFRMPQPSLPIASDLTHPKSFQNDTATPATDVRQRSNEGRSVTLMRGKKGDQQEVTLRLRPGGFWRQANWEIGRTAERSKAASMVKPFRPNDRFAAWRKSALRKARNVERRAMGRGGKKVKK